jgi:hypothetical protein
VERPVMLELELKSMVGMFLNELGCSRWKIAKIVSNCRKSLSLLFFMKDFQKEILMRSLAIAIVSMSKNISNDS